MITAKMLFAASLGGRGANGNEADAGSVIHAVPGIGPQNLDSRSLCGKTYGRRSIGWSVRPDVPAITCPRCLKAVERARFNQGKV